MNEEIIIIEDELEGLDTIEIEELSGDVSGSAAVHGNLSGRNEPDQHEIRAITGLRATLDAMKSLQTVYSDQKQQADYYRWYDDNPDNEARIGLFVAAFQDANGMIRIKPCGVDDDVFGVTVSAAGFVGGQPYTQSTTADDVDFKAQDNTTISTYGLVTCSGMANVQRDSDVQIGDYVVPNTFGKAKKSDGNGKYGYLVAAFREEYGVSYAVISLSAPSTIAQYLAEREQDLSTRMDAAESNIVTIGNIADDALTLSKENQKGAIVNKEEILEILGKLDKVDGDIGGLGESLGNTNTAIAEIRAIAEGASSEAAQASKAAVDNANAVSAELNVLIDNLEQLTGWVDAETGNTGAQYLASYIRDGVATKQEILTLDSKTEELTTSLKKSADGIESLAKKIDKYTVGEYSQAYNLTWTQAKSILRAGMVHIPTVDHTETYTGYEEIHKEYDGTVSNTQKFIKTYYYTWDGEQWLPSNTNAVKFMSQYAAGTEGDYWVVTGQDVENMGIIYELGGLYLYAKTCIELETWGGAIDKNIEKVYFAKDSSLYYYYQNGNWRSTTNADISGKDWIKVASVADNFLSRVVSSISQKANEVSAEITDAKRDAASLSIRLENDKSVIQTAVSYLEGSLATIKQQADENSAIITQVAEVIGEDGEAIKAAVTTAVKDDESFIHMVAENVQVEAIDYDVLAEKINFDGYVTFENLANDGETTISGGNIVTDSLSSISADLGLVEAGTIQSKGYKDLKVWGEESGKQFAYWLDSDEGVYYITGIGDYYEDTEIVIPSTYKGVPVSYIEDGAFRDNKKLKNIIIPDSITYIGEEAFLGCDNVVSITIPFVGQSSDGTGYKHFGYLFGAYNDQEHADCVPQSLRTVIITGDAPISGHAFAYCAGINEVVLSENTPSIYGYAFADCIGLTSIVIPKSVTYIESFGFLGCTNLGRIYYQGSEDEWSKVSVVPNAIPANTTVYYYSDTTPEAEGNYWYYDDKEGFRISCGEDLMIDSKHFKVSHDGHMVATSGAIGNCVIEEDGAIASANRNFIVDKDGNFKAVNAELQGDLQTSDYEYIHKILTWHDESICIDMSNGYTEGLSYSEPDENGWVYVTGIGNATDTDIVIPYSVDGHLVTGIGTNAFKNTPITSIGYLGESAIIGDNAFAGCTGLNRIHLPRIDTVGNLAFDGCDKLQYVFLGQTEEELMDSLNDIKDIGVISTISGEIPNGVDISLPASSSTPQYDESNQPRYTSTGITATSTIELGDNIQFCFVNRQELTDKYQIVKHLESERDTYIYDAKLFARLANNSTQLQYYYRFTVSNNKALPAHTYTLSGHYITGSEYMALNCLPTIFYLSSSDKLDDAHWHINTYSQGLKISSNPKENMIDSANFKVTQDGRMLATAGFIGNCEIYADGSIQSANNSFMIDSEGNVSVAGTINADDGYIGGLEIKNDGSLVPRGQDTTLAINGRFNVGNVFVNNNSIEANGRAINFDAGSSSATYHIAIDKMYPTDEEYEGYDVLFFTINKIPSTNITVEYSYITCYGSHKKTGTYIFTPNSSLKGNVRLPFYWWGIKDFKIEKINGLDVNALAGDVIIHTGDNISITGNLIPSSNNAYIFGDESNKWAMINASAARIDSLQQASASIDSSDRKVKYEIDAMDEKYSKLFDRLQPSTYKFTNGTSGRVHMGLIAQDVKDSLDECGISTDEFAAYCSWTKEDGTETCGIRYGELVALNMYEIQKLKKLVKELEEEVKMLKAQQNDSD